MTNNDQRTAATEVTATPVKSGPEKAAMFSAEIKKTWEKLSDEDVKLYDTQQDQFFTKLKEKQNVSKEDAQKRLTEIKASCGSCSSEKAA